MKLTKKHLRSLTREFLSTGRDSSIGRGIGCGSNKLLQIVRLAVSAGQYDPQNYSSVPISVAPGSAFSNMREEFELPMHFASSLL
jgi:hypothetical protein